MIKLLLSILLLTFNVNVAFSQQYDKLILGDWVSVKLVDASGNELENPQFKFDFEENLNCFFSSRSFDKGTEYKYSIKGNSLTINHANYEIVEITNNLLKIKQIEENDRIITYSRRKKPSLKTDSIVSYQCDTLNLSYLKRAYSHNAMIILSARYSKSSSTVNQLFSPKFLGYNYFYELFKKNIYYPEEIYNKSTTRYLNVSFEITEKGKIENVFVEEIGGDKWLAKRFEKVLKSKNNLWQPLRLDGNYIKSKIIITIKVEYEEKK